jgi:drug/metabolite transporter (DMT)-like permease
MDKLYALLGMLGNTGNDLIFKATAGYQSGRLISLFYLLQALFILPCSLLAVWLFRLGPMVHLPSILFGLPIGVGTYATYMLVLKSLVSGEVSTNITFFRLNFVVSSVLAVVLLDEILTVRTIVGLVLCGAAILTLFLSASPWKRRSHFGLHFSIPACVLAGGLNILIKTAFSAGALVTPINQLAFVFSSAGAMLIFKEPPSALKIVAITLAVASILTIA